MPSKIERLSLFLRPTEAERLDQIVSAAGAPSRSEAAMDALDFYGTAIGFPEGTRIIAELPDGGRVEITTKRPKASTGDA